MMNLKNRLRLIAQLESLSENSLYFSDSIYRSACSEMTDFPVNFMIWSYQGSYLHANRHAYAYVFTFDWWGLILGGVQHFFKSLWRREEYETPFPEVRQLAFILHSSMWLALCPCWLTRETLPGYRQNEKKGMSYWAQRRKH